MYYIYSYRAGPGPCICIIAPFHTELSQLAKSFPTLLHTVYIVM
jgi:hypothetical protein